MIHHHGTYFPDGETHLIDWMSKAGQSRNGVAAYQVHKYVATLELCPTRRTAVDVGANIGLWSRQMAMDFTRVVAYEPVARYRECFDKNVGHVQHVELHPCALGQESGGYVDLCAETPGSWGDTCVAVNGMPANAAARVPVRALDDFNLQDVDLVKIDVEGYERFVLEGAIATLRRCRPIVIVEQKPGNGPKYGLGERDAVTFLQELGARVELELSGDFVMRWGS